MSASRSPERPSGPPEPSRQRVHAPTASLESLERRAAIVAWIRRFFHERGVLEVETPVLCLAGAVDEHLEPIRADYHPPGAVESGEGVRRMFLLTSPEHGMKRLLAAGSGPIVQITRAFRDGERGRLHNPEFAIVEWYRPGWDPTRLMDEVEDLVRGVLTEATGPAPDGLGAEALRPFERVSYREAFRRTLDLDPFEASERELRAAARALGAESPKEAAVTDRDSLLNLILASGVEPRLGFGRPLFLFDYPASQAALARVRHGHPPVAERFELYVRGVELTNGYHELLDSREQARRIEEANAKRLIAGKEVLPADTRFLAALEAGLPDCSGVALGLDRLVMLALGCTSIDQVWAFPVEIA